MRVGIPREIKTGETRVALTPAGARVLTDAGAEVLVERSAGAASGFPDAAYAAAGARLVDRARLFDTSELIVKVKEPLADEPDLLHAGQTLFCYLHLAAMPELARRLLARGLAAIAYETVQLADGSLPLLAPMSAITGRLAVQVGAALLQSDRGGRGILLGGVPGVPPGKVLVLGAGNVGSNAVRVAMGLGARVVAVDRSPRALAALEQAHGGRVETLVPQGDAVATVARDADLVIGAVLVPGARAPVLLSREAVAAMPRGSVIVDVAIDQGGCVATTRPTSHAEPTYVEEGVIHYCVPNVPALVPCTSTLALTNVTLPHVLALATRGTHAALQADPALAAGLTLWGDRVCNARTAEALGLPAVSTAAALESAPLSLSA